MCIRDRISKLARPALHLDEKEKELYIHDFICGNVRYDKLKKAYSHEIIGCLLYTSRRGITELMGSLPSSLYAHNLIPI